MKEKILIILVLVSLFTSFSVSACTGFTASNGEIVLVGNNEDYGLECEPMIKIYPPENNNYGRIVFCNKPYPFDNMPYIEFGGMNDQGLFFDSFYHPYLEPVNPESKPVYNGWYIPNCLKSCSTVDEALEEFGQWYHPILDYNQILIVDRTGDSAIIEGDEIIRKEIDLQVCTNFLQSHPELGGHPCWRFDTAVNMLENMNELSTDYFKEICNATHSEGMYSYTIYSNIYDLTNGIVYLYFMHDYSKVKVFDLSEEMSLGTQSYFMSDLFDSENICPSTPDTPTGPSTGKINEEQIFFTKTIDLDSDSVYYLFDWGDNTNSGWIGPYPSGEECSASHSWSEQGNYEIKVKAKDKHGSESDWSDPLVVSMPRNIVCNPILYIFKYIKQNIIFYKNDMLQSIMEL